LVLNTLLTVYASEVSYVWGKTRVIDVFHDVNEFGVFRRELLHPLDNLADRFCRLFELLSYAVDAVLYVTGGGRPCV